MSMDAIVAPWSERQVQALNEFQHSGLWHPFTCGRRSEHPGQWPHQDEGILTATAQGWVCPVQECEYTQNWAYDMMADERFLEQLQGNSIFAALADDTEGHSDNRPEDRVEGPGHV